MLIMYYFLDNFSSLLKNENLVMFFTIIYSFVTILNIFIAFHPIKNSLFEDIPIIIELTKKITTIEVIIKVMLDNFSHDINPINDYIRPNTKLSYSQLKMVYFLRELEELDSIWHEYKRNNILNIRVPFEIAYQIRKILGTPIIKNLQDKEYVWLSSDEKECIKIHEMEDLKFIEMMKADENNDINEDDYPKEVELNIRHSKSEPILKNKYE